MSDPLFDDLKLSHATQNKRRYSVDRYQGEGVQILGAPTIVTRPNRRAMLTSSVPSLSYLERTGDDTFVIRGSGGSLPGVDISVKIAPSENDNVSCEFTTKIGTLRGTEDGTIAVAGVQVPIGKPVVETHEASRTITAMLPASFAIRFPVAEDGTELRALIEIREAILTE